ncbi:ATP-grasp domain-containing protein [Hyphomicrobium sp.]|uniref:ATP-grasp domain-containing protein n=1 Tax=Hyphomicrobium sp. TaxID=82 RepID=UPI002D76EADD|nr:ATP-grasp domain-containing protein [Hyphomicrobium sp.]HET6390391.1 ATP-grasp domain-containing protein [Hyphomicrobium sp.]
MKLHEFQTKQLLSDFGLKSPQWGVAITPDQAEEVATGLGTPSFVVKAQVDGFRRKLSDAYLVYSPAEVKKAAGDLLQRKISDYGGLKTQSIKRVMVEAAVIAERGISLSLFVDPAVRGIVMSAQNCDAAGNVAAFGQAGVQQLTLGTGHTFPEYDVMLFAARLAIPDNARNAFSTLTHGLMRAFVELDASRIEIDPLAIMPEGELLALSAVLTVDDNAMFRHPSLFALRADDELEINAQSYRLNYVSLDGDIGVAANGAGLGLATVDMIRAAKGRPANFMDIRTSATSVDIARGFAMILDNPKVRSLLINVHGGGMQPCDKVVEGLGIAMRRTGRSLPTVVRLAGNNAHAARARLEDFGCRIIDCADMRSAAEHAVAEAR